MLSLTNYQKQFSQAFNPAITRVQWRETPPSKICVSHGETLFGPATVLFQGTDVFAFSFSSYSQTMARYQKKWPRCLFQKSQEITPSSLLQKQSISMVCVGTAFQLSVWRQLLALNTKGLINYQTLAQAIGKPKAARAVANAVGANPIAIFIPCHRVIYSDGSLGGYHYGPELKQQILSAELQQRFNQCKQTVIAD